MSRNHAQFYGISCDSGRAVALNHEISGFAFNTANGGTHRASVRTGALRASTRQNGGGDAGIDGLSAMGIDLS